ncbi:competence/damage-inducible protein CinA [Thermodesulfobacterium geofontis OPF15]|jgi:nicotinamide-nucleotide amidase|uniref:CinA-like protein n=2 Tax=Thermodesulfobacterium geofontis TaxID=1295609 RepID=F8C4F8_THEGP|nr:nicotinamide-nucleotide amidohydrolase family protein [Thermodesulfobacterium geofontis]AEH22708.1 competence/damage-inducible protein CinA [Thermodesulfobacterium geofontis OPF15]
MIGALIFIGDELICGAIENTNSVFAGRILTSYGFEIGEIVTLPDKIEIISEYLKNLIEKYEFLIICGGLGPTDDDLTNLAVAKAFNLELKENKDFLSAIYSAKEYRKSQEIAKKMALIPEGAIPLSKNFSSAGYLLKIKNKSLFFLPGVPYQFENLLQTEVIPKLLELFPERTKRIIKTLRFFDLNETDLNQVISSLPEDILSPIKIGYYPIFPELKLILQGKEEKDLEVFINKLKETFLPYLVSEKDKSLPQVIGELLKTREEKLATAESCTGGMLASIITSVSGSSLYFDRGFVTYSPESKIELLGVKKETIEKFDVVSYEVAMEMAEGVRKKTKVDYALSITGFAGPTGGTPENPVGTVYIGFSYKNKIKAFRFSLSGDRNQIQLLASYTSLDILRRYLLYGESFFSYRFATGIKERTF